MRFFALFFLLFFLAEAAHAQGPGYGFPLRDLRQPPDTGMLVYTKFWQGRPAAFFEYVSLIPGIGGGGSDTTDLTGIRDSINFLYGIGDQEPDTIPVIVYKPAHGFDPDFCLFDGCILPLTASFDAATLTDPPFTYGIGAPDPDSLEVQFSGFYTTPSPHGLTVGQVYYLTNTPGTLSTTPGSVDIPVLLVIDANTVQLIDRTPGATSTTLRISIPTSQFTSRGADPRAPTDSIVSAIAALYQSAGLARPGALFVQQLPAATNNPTHQAGTNDPSTPVNGWVWDGLKVTRITQGRIAVNLQATEAGGSIPPVTLTPAAGPDSASVAAWIDANFASLPVPNGTILYWTGTGSELAPEYTYQILDDPTNTARRFIRLGGGGGGGDGNGIYGGSGTVATNAVSTVASGSTFKVGASDPTSDNTGAILLAVSSGGDESAEVNLNRSPIPNVEIIAEDYFGESSGKLDIETTSATISYNSTANTSFVSATAVGLNVEGLNTPILLRTTTLGDITLTPASGSEIKFGAPTTFTTMPTTRPGAASFWRHNSDGTGQYITATTLNTNLGYFVSSVDAARITSSTGSFLELENNGNISFSDNGGILGISAAGANLTYSGAAAGPVTLNSSNGTDVTVTAGSGIALNRVGTDLSISTAQTNPAGGSNDLQAVIDSVWAEAVRGASSPVTLYTGNDTIFGAARTVHMENGLDLTFQNLNGDIPLQLRTSDDQVIIGASDLSFSTLNLGNLNVSGGRVEVANGNIGPGEINLKEQSGFGSNSVSITAPFDAQASYTIRLPDSIGVAGQVLAIANVASGSIRTDWASAGGVSTIVGSGTTSAGGLLTIAGTATARAYLVIRNDQPYFATRAADSASDSVWKIWRFDVGVGAMVPVGSTSINYNISY